LQTHKDEQSFERWVADMWLAATGESVGDLMVKAGQAARVDIP
jgi:endonuclease YncB( thermonuclease family)